MRRWILAIPAALMLLSACGGRPDVEVPATFPPQAGATETAVPPTPTPAPPSELIVCLAETPASLYLYGDIGHSADTVLQSIYDGPIDLRGYRYASVILEKLPSLADGDAQIETISIASGDVYLNPVTLQPEMLTFGKPYLPVGCRSEDCILNYNSGEVQVERLRAEFEILDGVQWGDGTPLTARDSLLSYRLDGSPDTPSNKYLYARTRSYEALDNLRIEWIGIPGFLDTEFEANFWSPLPDHLLGEMTAAEVLQSEDAARSPLGWGPYSVAEWEPDGDLRLTRNPNYFRSDDGRPAFETLLFRFLDDEIGTALDQLRTGECDLLDENVLDPAGLPELSALASEGEFVLQISSSAVVERLEFNHQPVTGSGAALAFASLPVRQAVRACVNRDAIVEGLLDGSVQVTNSFLPAGHPDYASPADLQEYDPAAGQELLEQAGWREGEDGVRTSAGGRLEVELYHLPTTLAADVASRIVSDLGDCGFQVNAIPLDTDELFAPYPEGPIFGRTFGMAIYAWPGLVSPPCEMFASWEVPGEDHPFGINASGFASDPYDRACRQILFGPAQGEEYQQAVQAVQFEFANQLPGLALFSRPRIVAHADWLCDVSIDPSNPSVLVDLELIRPCDR